VHNLHGIPGLLGGIVSAIAAASYNSWNTTDAYRITNNDFPYYDALVYSPFKQGGIQIAATFISLGIGVVTAIITYFIVRIFYNFNSK